ncbi:50S ribosomal protein L18 [bacterium]|jgi:large subunit ribosomal protein L18|nr:50S ribosomal protein L18 [bacterium]|tara:strand:+ start:5257 stop:5577 length:321 start_codon:yes stop_codon:yes gene_type:complete
MSRKYYRQKRAKIKSNRERLRLSVFRSNRHIVAQIIDDSVGNTLVQASSLKGGGQDIATAQAVGTALAERALKGGIKRVVFDRGNQVYAGRIKALADAARSAGLDF